MIISSIKPDMLLLKRISQVILKMIFFKVFKSSSYENVKCEVLQWKFWIPNKLDTHVLWIYCYEPLYQIWSNTKAPAICFLEISKVAKYTPVGEG